MSLLFQGISEFKLAIGKSHSAWQLLTLTLNAEMKSPLNIFSSIWQLFSIWWQLFSKPLQPFSKFSILPGFGACSLLSYTNTLLGCQCMKVRTTPFPPGQPAPHPAHPLPAHHPHFPPWPSTWPAPERPSRPAPKMPAASSSSAPVPARRAGCSPCLHA